jgi:tripartite ATP-independent transporter DctP family solute receptor
MTAGRGTRREFVAGLLGAAVAPAARAEDSLTLRAADVHTTGYPTVAAVEWLNEELERELGGTLRLRIYHSGQLGSEKDTLELARVGALALTRVHSSVLNNVVPATRILSLPYVFDSTDHLRRTVDGAFGDAILAACERRGLIGLAIYDSGARCIYSTRGPVLSPEDLRGLKLRVPQSDIFLESVRALGASPTPLAYGAVFSSLQTRLIDGAENNVPSFHSSRHFEIARFWSTTEHSYAPDMLLMSRRVADALPPAQLEFLRAAARRSVTPMRARWDTTVAVAERAVAASGVAVNAVDKDAFRQAVAPVLTRYLADPELARLHAAVREAA